MLRRMYIGVRLTDSFGMLMRKILFDTGLNVAHTDRYMHKPSKYTDAWLLMSSLPSQVTEFQCKQGKHKMGQMKGCRSGQYSGSCPRYEGISFYSDEQET